MFRICRAVVLALAVLLAIPLAAFADRQQVDNHPAAAGLQNTVRLTASPGAPVSTSARLVVERSGSANLAPGTEVTFVVNPAQTTLPAGYSAASVALRIPAVWSADRQSVAGTSRVAFTAPARPGLYTYVVKWTTARAHGNALTGGPALEIALEVVAPVDTTPPTIVAVLDASPNDAGWHKADVTVRFVCADAESGVASCSDPVTLGGEGVDLSATGTAVDNAGNRATAVAAGINIDRTAPTIAASRTPANAAGWSNVDVVVSFACADGLSGVAACAAPIVVATEGAGQSATGQATDRAGNASAATLGGINVDKTAPTVAYIGNAGAYTVDQTVAIACAAADALSGVAATTCADVAGPAYAFPLGANAVAAEATDRAGNVGSGATGFTVSVTYDSLCNLTGSFVENAGIAGSMCTKLRAAEAAALRGNTTAKTGALGAYVNQVVAQSGKSLTAAHANILIRLAGAL